MRIQYVQTSTTLVIVMLVLYTFHFNAPSHTRCLPIFFSLTHLHTRAQRRQLNNTEWNQSFTVTVHRHKHLACRFCVGKLLVCNLDNGCPQYIFFSSFVITSQQRFTKYWSCSQEWNAKGTFALKSVTSRISDFFFLCVLDFHCKGSFTTGMIFFFSCDREGDKKIVVRGPSFYCSTPYVVAFCAAC